MSFEVWNNLMHTLVFTFSWLPRHHKNRFCTVFNTPACAQLKNDNICILELKLVNALTKEWIRITFVEIECNFSLFIIQSDSYVYQSANFDPRIKITVCLHFAWAGLLKTVQKYLSRCLGSWKIGKTKMCIKLIETSLFTILNVGLSL